MADNAIPKMLEALAELEALGVKPGDVVRYCRQTTTDKIAAALTAISKEHYALTGEHITALDVEFMSLQQSSDNRTVGKTLITDVQISTTGE